MIIKDPYTGLAARVEEGGKLLTESTTESEFHAISEEGGGYSVGLYQTANAFVVPPTSGSALIFLKNTSDSQDIILEKIMVSSNSSQPIRFDVEVGNTIGTISNGAAVVPINNSTQHSNQPPVTCYIWDGVSSMSGINANGDKVYNFYAGPGLTQCSTESSRFIGPNSSFVINVYGDDVTKITFFISFYMEDISE